MYSLNVYSLKLIKNDKGEFDLAIDYSEKRNIGFIKNNEKRISIIKNYNNCYKDSFINIKKNTGEE